MPPNPRNLLLLAILLIAAITTAFACTEPTPTPTPVPPIPDNTTWILESIDGNPIIQDSFVMLKIEENWITGYDGCNRYSGRLEDETPITEPHGDISFPPVARTQRDCPDLPGVTDQSDVYITALMQGKTYRVTDNQLEFLDDQGNVRLTFTQQTPLQGSPIDLTGTAWRLVSEDDANPATLAFLDHRLLTGDTACRSYLATYSTDDETIRFPSHSMLKRSEPCSDDARRLEGKFGDFQTWAREYAVHEQTASIKLTIRSAEGETLTFEPLPTTVQKISDTEWTLTAIVELREIDTAMWHPRSDHAIEGPEVTLSINDNRISGSAGCNSYSVEAKISPDHITINPETYFWTEKWCNTPQGIMEQEKRYLDLLQNPTRYGIFHNNLYLQTENDTFLLFRSK